VLAAMVGRPVAAMTPTADYGAPFADLTPPYATIVVDPPWPYPEGFAGGHSGSRTNPARPPGPVMLKALPYSAMTLDEIRAMPVSVLAADNCRLFLWTTNRYLPDAFTVLRTWGFRYRQTLVWHKTAVNMPAAVAPNSAEFLLVAVRGDPPRVAAAPSAVIPHAGFGRAGGHSRKPSVFLDLVEHVSAGPYVELFARAPRLGWDHWGYGYESAS
jgi:N6-adenosine-specific RNA methylase IME4